MSELDLSHVTWQKSSLSGAGQNCVEVGLAEGTRATSEHATGAEHLLLIRDSKDPDGPVLTLTPSAWDAFVANIKSGALTDLL
ncbi:DUF397 domain-containing protein [Streptosporangium sp. NBC_01755]|uniref:DUF397 domain-containing protein n=1 Tax=Streptosporangium sp. NBC_01755 TaxID=2975949 RepID=UPI002DD85BFF|nr:DUF397 domain-containing protein [Streptosporangium sp. NBC_01755]WSC98177.1 DUF397 domain-containing protein [Streptosporangium sp. NBC_01755]